MVFIAILVGCIIGALLGMNAPIIPYSLSGNAILSILLTYLGERLNVDIYLAAIVVFVGRMFVNLAIIRRHYIDKWTNKQEYVEQKEVKKEEKQD